MAAPSGSGGSGSGTPRRILCAAHTHTHTLLPEKQVDPESVGPAPKPRSHHWKRTLAKIHPSKSQCANTDVQTITFK